jgi:hypothetical protein
MKQAFHIPVWRTILNWAIALVIGSILWPCMASLFKGGPSGRIDELGGIMLISAVLGGLTSLPAMLLLTLTNWLLNRNKLASGPWIRIHILVHIVIGMLTFLVIYAYNNSFSGREFFAFLVLGVTYILAGIGTWSVTFMIYKRRLVTKPERREDILDELE